MDAKHAGAVVGLLMLTACSTAVGSNASTTSAAMLARSDADLRRIEAFQTKNPGWTVQLDERGRTVATKRWASLMREDIRGEIGPFLQSNAAELGAEASMRRVVDEPTHVRYEAPASSAQAHARVIDARLRDGALVVCIELQSSDVK